jgi:SAM-dependent methyltransferase
VTNAPCERIPCNICGDGRQEVIYPASRPSPVIDVSQFRSSGDEPLADPLVKCAACGFQYVSPRIPPSLVLEGYTNAQDETFVSQASSRENTFRRCLAALQKIWRKKPGKVLDVGTANGSFLKAAKDAGWEVYGCEPNRWLGGWCRTHYGIDVIPGTVFDAKFQGSFFDVLTLWDVLEHTPDPRATLQECARLLKNDGLLVVNYPDIGSWIARAMGRKWVFLLSVHYFYFDRASIRRLLEKLGFEILVIKPHFQSLELDYVLFRATQYVKFFASIPRKLVQLLGIGKVQIPYWVGQTLVVARKTG